MPRPFKHPKTGIYYFRQKVPADLRAKLGDRIISRSLRTKDPEQAKLRNAEEVRKQAMSWEAHRKGPSPLPLQKIVALSGIFYREYMASLEAEPGEVEVWEALLALLGRLDGDQEALTRWYASYVDNLLLQHSLVTDDHSRGRLIGEMHRTLREAAEQQMKRAQGDYSPDPNLARFPPAEVVDQSNTRPSTQDHKPSEANIWALFKLWEADHVADGKSAKTVGDYRQKVQSLVDFVGHENVSQMASRNIVDWCDYLRHDQGLTGKTIKAKYLAAVRAVCSVGKSRQRITMNPAEGVEVRATRAPVTRSQGFTDQEALKILTAAMVDPAELGRRSIENKRAIRWGPWLCAFTGARVTEIMQLRKSDVVVDGAMPYLCITPEAGSVKTGKFRNVPLHPQIIEMGFLEMVRGLPDGPLFFKLDDKAAADPLAAAQNAGDKIRAWVRSVVGIKEAIQPNHAWRHRFKTVCRDVGLHPEVVDALVGHEDGRASTHYGEYTVRALGEAVCQLPRYAVKA